MASVEERFNNILQNSQIRYNNEQTVNERFNNIINNVNNNKSVVTNTRRTFNNIKRAIPEYRKQLEEEQKRRKSQELKKQASNINSINNNTGSYEENKKNATLNLPTKYQGTKLTLENVNKINEQNEKNIEQKRYQNAIQPQGEIKLPDGSTWRTNTSKAIKLPDGKIWYTNINDYEKDESTSGKLLRNMQSIGSNLYNGAESGVANFIDDSINTTNWIDRKYQEAGVLGKVAIGLVDPGAVSRSTSKKIRSDESKNKEEKNINEIQDTLKFVKEKNEEENIENINNTTNKLAKKVSELAPSLGNNLMGMGLSAINPAVGTTYFINSASGSYYDEAIQRGMNEDQAMVYSKIMGGLEGATEEVISGQNIKGFKGILEGTGFKNAVKSFGIEVGENFLQEAIMEPLSEGTTYITAGKEYMKYDLSTQKGIQELLEASWSSGVDGALSSILLGGVSRGVASAISVTNKLSGNQRVTQQEIIQAVQDSSDAGVNVQEELQKNILKSAEKQIVQSQRAKSTYYDYYTDKKADKNTQKVLNEAEDIINRNKTSNFQQNSIKNQNNNQQQQINQIKNKNVLNSNIERQNNYIASAQQYNIDTNNQSVRKIGELANKRGINITYDDSLFKNNKNANAIYQTTTDKNGNVTRNIILNPNANTNRTLEQIELHEIVHDMYGTEQFNKIKDMVLEYDKGKDGYQEARKALEELYSQVYDKNSSDFQNLVDEEAVADILGNKLGDQQFVNKLVNMKESRSIARKIYDWVVEKLNNMTRSFENMNSYFYWKDVKNKFEEAFRQEYQGNSNLDTKYFIETVASFDEMEYNRVKPIKLPNREYAILSGIVNSDSNIKPGLNYVETTNATYEVYFKETGEFKVTGKYISGGKNDNSSERNLSRTNETGNVRSGEQINSEQVSNRRTRTYNDEVSNINKRQKSNTNRSGNDVDRNSTNVNKKYSMQESENNSGSFNLPKNHKQHQLEIIKKYNPMNDDYHTGIRNIEDIKTLEETLKDSDWADYDEFNPDLTKQDINTAIETGKITVYSSYPIEQGTFISPSRMEAESYSENGKVYSKEVNIKDIAWIDPTQGQYAKVDDTKYSTQSNNAWQEHLDKNYKNNNKGTMLQDVKLPTKQNIQEQQNIQDTQDYYNEAEYPVSKESTLKNAINDALINKNPKGAILLGKVKGNIATKIKNILGIDVNNRVHSLSKTDIRHMMAQHGNQQIENSKGQIAITREDILKIPDIINNPDDIIKGTDNKNGKTVRYIKNYGDNISFVVEVVPEKSGRMNIKTMWKKPTALTNSQTTPDSTSKTTDSLVSSTSNNIIPQNTINMQEQQKNSSILPKNNLKNDKDLQAIQSNTIDYISNKRTKDKTSFKQTVEYLNQKLINKGYYIDKLSEQTKNPELKYKYDRLLNSFSEAQYSIGKAQTDNNGNVVGKSLIEVFKPADDAKLSKEFEDYLLNRHNIDRKAVEKSIYGNEITAQDSKKTVENYEKTYPQFKKWADDVYKYNNNQLQSLVDAGFLSKDVQNMLKDMYGSYVPTYRDINQVLEDAKSANGHVNGNPLKRAKGGDQTILSVREAMAEQTIAYKKALRMNEVGQELLKTLGKENVLNNNVDTQYGSPEAIYDLAGNVVEKVGKNNVFTVFQDGMAYELKINDELYSAFEPTLIQKVQNSKLNTILNPIAKVTQWHKNLLTTYSIGFSFNNPIKDFQDALVNTKYTDREFIKNYTKALKQMATKGEYYESYKRNGGMANTYFDYEKGILPTKKNIVQKMFFDNIRKMNEVIEQAPRLAEYITTLEHGGTINEALYNASEITTNFKRGGDVTKAFNKYGAEFLNASVQGLDKVYRNITGQNGFRGYANLAVKATISTVLPAVLNHLLLRDDDDYEELSDYNKNNYFLFKIGDGKFLRIPKGRVSSLIGTIAREMLEIADGEEFDIDNIVETAVNQLAPNNPLTDNIISPIMAVKNNEAWYGGKIVSDSLSKLPEAEQYDETTDSFSKWLGDKINVSPKKINYLIDQYSGGVGDVVLPMLTPKAENNIIEDKFITDSVIKNKNPGQFYEKLEELEKKKNSLSSTNEDILKYKYLSSVSSDLSDYYKQKHEIQNSTDLSDEEKKEQVREVQKNINDITKKALENLDNANITDLTASIGDKQYYCLQGEWKTLTEEEESKNKNISLQTYADYKNKVAKESEKLADDEKLKNSEKINILVKSSYSKKEKEAIYENYIGTQDELYSVVMKNTGININEYLNYKAQEFTSDKKDDGTVDGKSISGSKKKKVFEYVNNMKITGEQRLLLLGTQYKLTNSERIALAQYVKSLNITNKEKLAIYNKLQGFKVYKDGRVTY